MKNREVTEAFRNPTAFVVKDWYRACFFCIKLCDKGFRVSWDDGCRCCVGVSWAWDDDVVSRHVVTIFNPNGITKSEIVRAIARTPEILWVGNITNLSLDLSIKNIKNEKNKDQILDIISLLQNYIKIEDLSKDTSIISTEKRHKSRRGKYDRARIRAMIYSSNGGEIYSSINSKY